MNRASAHRSRLAGRSRSGLNPGAAIAVGATVGFIAIPIALAVVTNSRSSVTVASTSSSLPTPLPPSLPNAGVVLASSDDHFLESLPRENRGRAVVLSMFRPPVDAAMKSRVDESLAAIRALGFETVDNIDFAGQADVEDRERNDLLASLRTRRELASSEPEEAAGAVREWIESMDPAYTLAVILAPGPKNAPEDPDELVCLMAGRARAAWSEDPSTKEIALGALRSVGNEPD